MIENFNFYLITVLAVIILTILVGWLLHNYILIPVFSFILMTLAAFVIPNFIEGTDWKPLFGYAVFLGVLSLIVSILVWMYVKGRKRKKELSTSDGGGKPVDTSTKDV
ncbi:hypothetical protein GCM10022378_15860 [Salinicoccus jeotgali]|uniref:Permease n=1 Tax=Salinicoccus jeotgali TaxID=381634 RepID=A0ABP7EYD4_9STAP